MGVLLGQSAHANEIGLSGDQTPESSIRIVPTGIRLFNRASEIAFEDFYRIANNPAHPLAAPLPYGFEWLHIPKTGSSFAATLWSFACTRRGRIDLSISNDVGGSQALPWSKSFLFHDLYGEPLPFELFLIVMCMCTCTGIYAYRYIYTGTHA